MTVNLPKEILTIVMGMKSLEDLDPNSLLIDSGILDSFDIINLVTILEENYAIVISGGEIISDNLNTINDIALLVERLIGERDS